MSKIMINGNVQNHGNVQYHEFPRFGHFVKRNGPDTGAILTQNVIPVISVQPILYQLPYGATKETDRLFHDFINYTIPYRTPLLVHCLGHCGGSALALDYKSQRSRPAAAKGRRPVRRLLF